VNKVGRRVDQTTPLADARLQDGSRVNVIVPPLSLRGTAISIVSSPKSRSRST
jgi:pilus assembly protein CpaF